MHVSGVRWGGGDLSLNLDLLVSLEKQNTRYSENIKHFENIF